VTVNWGRQIEGEYYHKDDGPVVIINPSDHEDQFLELIRSRVIREKLADRITFLSDPNRHCYDDRFYLPAIVLPIEGKYEISCPAEHQDALRQRLAKTSGILAIGVSAKDQDLLDLLSANLAEGAGRLPFYVVGGSDAIEAVVRFQRGVPQLATTSVNTFNEGFRLFVDSGGVEDFVKHTLAASTARFWLN
jgi:hypothetical protein